MTNEIQYELDQWNKLTPQYIRYVLYCTDSDRKRYIVYDRRLAVYHCFDNISAVDEFCRYFDQSKWDYLIKQIDHFKLQSC